MTGLAARSPVQQCAPRAFAAIEGRQISEQLDSQIGAVVRHALSGETCAALAHLYSDDERFRSRVSMSRHGFGRGEYKYFSYPLPETVAVLRTSLYPPLAGIANRWNERMRIDVRYPGTLDEYLKHCHAAGQTKPTPLMLKYVENDYNCLHQDRYGEHLFPLQATFLLSEPGRDFGGGEFVLTEQRPRRQSRAEVVPLGCGDGVIFPVHHRPVRGSRGFYRAIVRHGVSRLRAGHRLALGIIFHDAE
ncbi:2OG-Fe(II) oxygenase [soil metagenome]